MATYSYGRLGASAPSATTNTTLFQGTASHEYILDKTGVTVCNRDTSDATFRVARVDSGTSVANEDYIEYDQRIAGNSSIDGILTRAVMSGTDSIIVYASTANLSFTVGGLDIDNS